MIRDPTGKEAGKNLWLRPALLAVILIAIGAVFVSLTSKPRATLTFTQPTADSTQQLSESRQPLEQGPAENSTKVTGVAIEETAAEKPTTPPTPSDLPYWIQVREWSGSKAVEMSSFRFSVAGEWRLRWRCAKSTRLEINISDDSDKPIATAGNLKETGSGTQIVPTPGGNLKISITSDAAGGDWHVYVDAMGDPKDEL